ncbi:hypothetical protein [Ruthenibacterium lactatiformans]|uniref:hypothetical protein n=1 Tax=Ruthenibacterium lactatiformans TaxID=1550024 RepID=UPI00351FEEBF
MREWKTPLSEPGICGIMNALIFAAALEWFQPGWLGMAAEESAVKPVIHCAGRGFLVLGKVLKSIKRSWNRHSFSKKENSRL